MLVSVIIPAYNVEKFIARCLESVLNQTYSNIEIIIVNDGSTDKTVEIIQRFSNSHENINLISTTNNGVSSARNTGILAAKGEYLFFLDSDDRIKLESIQLMLEKIGQDNSDICFGGWEVYSEQDELLSDYLKDGFMYLDKHVTGFEACKLKVQKYMWICQGTAIYKRQLLVENNITFSSGYAYGEDIEFINKALFSSNRVSSIRLNILENVSREGSALNTSFNEKFLDALYLNRHFYNFVRDKSDISKEQTEKLLISIDNDYNNILLNVYKRLLLSASMQSANAFVRSKNLKLINLKGNFTLRTIGVKWKLKYYLFRINFILGAIFTKYFRTN